jgi:KUP system potassium uptake protein
MVDSTDAPRLANTRSAEARATRCPAHPGHWSALSLGALGVVYGDIGTSPLYAFSESLGKGAVPDPARVLAVASLIFWALVLVVALKYAWIVLSVDNRGEGGILALLALGRQRKANGLRWPVYVGLVGAALLLADGVITPAMTVLGAVEGLRSLVPSTQPLLPFLALAILCGVFALQSAGTGRIGGLFGPIVLVWMVSIALVGLPWILARPDVFLALDPRLGLRLLVSSWQGYFVLGGVVLCVTGAEALYADLGHFGRHPIRLAGYGLVLPALMLSYFGQAAYLLAHPDLPVGNTFYDVVPAALRLPAVGLATLAAIVASQALISGAFSLTQQAIQLGFLPRLTIVHTSAEVEGRIYMPQVNGLLFCGCAALTLGFKNSSELGAAYGVAVTGTMAATSVLFYFATKRKLGPLRAGLLAGAFLALDLAFLGANISKLLTGAWVTLLIAFCLLAVMFIWYAGTEAVRRRLRALELPLSELFDWMKAQHVARVPGAAVFLTREDRGAPPMLTHYITHTHSLHEHVALLHVHTVHVPTVPEAERLKVETLPHGFLRVVASYGFVEIPDLGQLLGRLQLEGIVRSGAPPTLFVGHSVVTSSNPSRFARARVGLFSFLLRNAHPASTHYRLPAHQVMELGVRVEL